MRIRINREKFAAALARLDITGNELSEQTGVSRSTITAIRSGKSVNRETAQRVASVLGGEIMKVGDWKCILRNSQTSLLPTKKFLMPAAAPDLANTICGRDARTALSRIFGRGRYILWTSRHYWKSCTARPPGRSAVMRHGKTTDAGGLVPCLPRPTTVHRSS